MSFRTFVAVAIGMLAGNVIVDAVERDRKYQASLKRGGGV